MTSGRQQLEIVILEQAMKRAQHLLDTETKPYTGTAVAILVHSELAREGWKLVRKPERGSR
jgi:hypothetical protein